MTDLETMDIMPGGYTETRDADRETQWICDQVRPLVQGKTNKIYQEYRAIEYRSQVVAGTNYLIKVCVGGPNYIHLLVFQGLNGWLQLSSVQANKTLEEPLKPFIN